MFIKKFGLLSCISFVVFLIGAYFIGQGVISFFDSMNPPEKFEEAHAKELVSGQPLEGDFLYSLGRFDESFDTDKDGNKIEGTEKILFVVAMEDMFLGYETSNPDEIKGLDEMAKKTVPYLKGESKLKPNPVHFTGRCFNMSDKSIDAMKQALQNHTEFFDSYTILEYKNDVFKNMSRIYIVEEDFSFKKELVKKGAMFILTSLAIIMIRNMIIKSRNNREYVYIERETENK